MTILPTMEPVQEVEEPKESPIKPQNVAESPAHQLTSVSSSTTSPSSVRLNQEYVELQESTSNVKEPNTITNEQSQTIVNNDSFNNNIINNTNTNNNNNNNINSNSNSTSQCIISGDDLENEVQIPLLDEKNSTNMISNHYNIGETDALLENSN